MLVERGEYPLVMAVADPRIQTQVDHPYLLPKAYIRPEILRQILERIVSDVKAFKLKVFNCDFVERVLEPML